MSTSNKLLFKHKLSLISWENLGIQSYKVNSFYDIIYDLFNKCYPFSHRRAKVIDTRKPYINDILEALLRKSIDFINNLIGHL